MYCKKCENEVEEGMKFCNKCGAEIENTNKKQKKIRFKVSDVVNRENVLNCSNRVAYIASGWALKVRNRGVDIGIIIAIIYFFIACAVSSDVDYRSGISSAEVFFSTFRCGDFILCFNNCNF